MKSKRSIWIVEDDESAQFVYRECLDIRYDVRCFVDLSSFKTALVEAKDEPPNIVIADLRLASESFLEFLSQDVALLRKVPFIVISSVDDLDALRYCFVNGAVDYITKPFGKNELIVKIEKYLSDSTQNATKKSQSPIRVDPTTLRVHRGDRYTQPLTSKEFQIFISMQQEWEKGIRRADLTRKVWREVHVEGKALDVHLCNLRKKLGELGVEIVFETPDLYRLSCDRMDPELPGKASWNDGTVDSED